MVSLKSFVVILQLVSWIPLLHLNSSKEGINGRNVYFVSSFVMFNWSRALLRIMACSISNKEFQSDTTLFVFLFLTSPVMFLLVETNGPTCSEAAAAFGFRTEVWKWYLWPRHQCSRLNLLGWLIWPSQCVRFFGNLVLLRSGVHMTPPNHTPPMTKLSTHLLRSCPFWIYGHRIVCAMPRCKPDPVWVEKLKEGWWVQ